MDFRPCRGLPGEGGGATLGRGRLYGLKLRCGTVFFGPGVKALALATRLDMPSSSESDAAIDSCRATLDGAGDAIRAILAAVDCRRRAGFFSDGGGGMSTSMASSVSLIGLGLNAEHALARAPPMFDHTHSASKSQQTIGIVLTYLLPRLPRRALSCIVSSLSAVGRFGSGTVGTRRS